MDVYRYESYDHKEGWITAPESGASLSCGDLQICNNPNDFKKSELYIQPELMSGSDYSNSNTVQESNHRVFLDQFKDVEGVHDVWGGHGTYGIAIRLDIYESHLELKEIVDSLEDYGILDSDDLYELEDEKSNEAWDNWARHDMARLIQNSHEYLEDFDDDDKLTALFYEACDEANQYWGSETGGSMYINLEEIAPYLRDVLLVETVDSKDLPLLISHDWVSKRAQTLYAARLSGELHDSF